MYKKFIVYTNFILLLLSTFFSFLTLKNDLIYPIKYEKLIINYSNEYNLSDSLIASIIFAESNYNEYAKSNKSAIGLMQLKLETANYILNKYNLKLVTEEELLIPENNIKIGCMYLRYLFDKFKTTKETICSYNAGEGNVKKWLINKEYSTDGKTLTKIPFVETSNYLEKINKAEIYYKRIYNN